ncbi:hypothetical protein BH20ACI4_BH20ACI4_03500 [soil metagenome]
MDKLKVFIGSSSEAKEYAQIVQEILQEVESDIEIIGWWKDNVFASGDTHIESLFNAISKTNTAVLIFAEDDSLRKRGVDTWTTRDNILLEYGMFAAAHGRNNVLLLKLGNPSLPTDLSGVNHVILEKCEDSASFKEKNRGKIRSWIEGIKKIKANKFNPESSLPRLYQVMLTVLGASRSYNPDFASQIDYMAAELVTAMSMSLQTDNLGVNDALAEQVVRYYLYESISISAHDATGPASWVSPTVFRYLASQIRQYLWSNIINGKWHLCVHEWLGEAINLAISNAQKRLDSQSLTIFDNPNEFHWEIGTPTLQYSRVLAWTKEELMHPIAESIISIHEAFNIPLFFVETEHQSKDKSFAYIVFENNKGKFSGLYGKQTQKYHTNPFTNGIPGFGIAIEEYKRLLKHKDLMFATDARTLLLA